jgi:hypothetical protein
LLDPLLREESKIFFRFYILSKKIKRSRKSIDGERANNQWNGEKKSNPSIISISYWRFIAYTLSSLLEALCPHSRKFPFFYSPSNHFEKKVWCESIITRFVVIIWFLRFWKERHEKKRKLTWNKFNAESFLKFPPAVSWKFPFWMRTFYSQL